MRRTFLKGVLGIAALAATRGLARAQAGEIRIGGLVAASGPGAFIGASEKNALEMAVEQKNSTGGISGNRIRLFLYDTEGNSTNAAQQFRRLAESDNVHAVIGPSTTGESVVVRPIANELHVPLISMGGAEAIVNPPTPYVFKVPPSDRVVAEHIIGFMKAKGMHSVGLISSADGFGQAGAIVIKEVAQRLGVQVAAAEEFGPRDTDMTPQVLRIRRANADAMLIWSVNPGPTIILKNATAVAYDKPIFNSYGAASLGLIEQAGPAAERSYVSSMRLLAPESLSQDDPMREVVARLATGYRNRFHAEPTTFIGHPQDALELVDLAVRQSGGEPNRDSIAAAIRSGNISFPGANGLFHFTSENHSGLDEESQSMVMLQVRGGRFVMAQ